MRFVAALVAVLAVLCGATAVLAQPGIPTTSGTQSSGAMRGGGATNGQGGEMMIDVNIWGFVRNPGKYTVPVSMRLMDLISQAGGPTERANLAEVKVVHDRNVDTTMTELVRIIDVEKYQNTGDPASNPLLVPNDVIIIPGDSLNEFNEILSVVSNVAVVTLSVVGLIIALKPNN